MSETLFSLEGKVAVVTGASRGIGRAAAVGRGLDDDARGLATAAGERVQVDFTGIYVHRVPSRGRGRAPVRRFVEDARYVRHEFRTRTGREFTPFLGIFF